MQPGCLIIIICFPKVIPLADSGTPLVNDQTEWRDRGIIPFESAESAERTMSGHDENVEALSHTDVCDCGERQTMSHLMTCGDAPNCTWTDLAMPTLAGVNCA